LVFAAWHASAITLNTGLDLSVKNNSICLINNIINWIIRTTVGPASGSALVPGLAHAIWTGTDCPLFDFGEIFGALEVVATQLYGLGPGLPAMTPGVTTLTLL